jgi:ABC-type phosphate transport system substrate-binding protein
MKTKSTALLLVFLSALPAFAGNGYRVIANPSVKSSVLSKTTVSSIFMKRTMKWDDGTAIVAFDQSEKSPARATFSTDVLGRSAGAVKNYWNQQIYSGRDLPPVEKASDEEVLSVVRSTPGAVGYVSETADVSRVKVIEVQ